MSSIWGEKIKISIFGESHGAGIGVTLDGLPAGEAIDMSEILRQMSRRAPGKNTISTQRREADIPEILSGFYNGRTTGTPLCAVVRNSDTRSGDYELLSRMPRPGHADFTGSVKYKGFNDPRGGGHFSGRLTAPMVFAGAVCRQILSRRGVEIGAHLSAREFPALDPEAEKQMKAAISEAKASLDSVGGVVECAAAGIPAGLGDPIFGGVENLLSSIIFGIPGVRGIEFGSGFAAASMTGSTHNDAFIIKDGEVKTKTNRHGGILGGITTSMPLLFRVAFKPTPSIFREQESVDLKLKKSTRLNIQGRHDPCIAVRAVPVVESLAAVCLLGLLMEG